MGSEEEGERLLPAVFVFLEKEESPPDDKGEDGDEEKLPLHEDHGAAVNFLRTKLIYEGFSAEK